MDNHARLFRDALGQKWSPPVAYRWLHYEDPDPVARLIEGSRRLETLWDELWSRRGATLAPLLDAAAEHEARHLGELAALVKIHATTRSRPRGRQARPASSGRTRRLPGQTG